MSDPSFVEVDALLSKICEQDEIDDYIYRGIYPERLKSKPIVSVNKSISLSATYHDIINIPLLDTDYVYHNTSLTDIYHITGNIGAKIDYLKYHLQLLDVDASKSDTCPICIEVIDMNNCVHPRCGHAVCIPCFTNNIRRNSYTPTLCSMCRSTIM